MFFYYYSRTEVPVEEIEKDKKEVAEEKKAENGEKVENGDVEEKKSENGKEDDEKCEKKGN